MAIDTAILDRDFANILADMPETATIGADPPFTVNRTNIRNELQSRSRDFIDNYQLTLIFRVRDFTEASPVIVQPSTGDKLTFDSRTYRVMATDDSPDGVSLRVHLQAEYSGDLT